MNASITSKTVDAPARPDAENVQTGRQVAPVQLVDAAADAGRVLIVDDEVLNIKVVTRYLEREGLQNVASTTDPRATLSMIASYRPDVVLLDVMMPEINGIDVLRTIREQADLRLMPVLILTADSTTETKQKCLELGATDFLQKPVDPTDLIPRVRNAIAVKTYQDRLMGYAADLERRVRERTAELEQSRRQIVRALARAAEYRDNETAHHVCRVGKYVGIIARQLGFSQHEAEDLDLAAQLHDVGKIAIPDQILHKPGKLDPDEYDIVKRHALIGQRIIEPYDPEAALGLRRHANAGFAILSSDGGPLMELAATIARSHHERWDGTGYPLGLAGEDIPIEGRMTAVADVFDALSSVRPYKPAFPRQKCFDILEEGRGTQFDPKVLDAFFTCGDQIVRVQQMFADIY